MRTVQQSLATLSASGRALWRMGLCTCQAAGGVSGFQVFVVCLEKEKISLNTNYLNENRNQKVAYILCDVMKGTTQKSVERQHSKIIVWQQANKNGAGVADYAFR